DLWFVVLGSLAVFLGGPRPAADVAARFVAPRAAPLLVALGVLLLVVVVGGYRHISEATLHAAVAKEFPAGAAAFVKAEREQSPRDPWYDGPLFNDLDWGGYLIWALPELPVSIDGRMNLHGDARLERNAHTGFGRDIFGKPDSNGVRPFADDDLAK